MDYWTSRRNSRRGQVGAVKRHRVWGFPQTGSRFILVNHALILHASEFRPPSNHGSISNSTQPFVDSVSPPPLVLDYSVRSRMLQALSEVCYLTSDRAMYKHLCRKSPVVTYLTKWSKHSLARRLRKWDLSVNFLVNWMLSKKIFYWSPQALIFSDLCYTVLVNTLTQQESMQSM